MEVYLRYCNSGIGGNSGIGRNLWSTQFRELVESIPESVEVKFDPIPEFRVLVELIPGTELIPGMCNIAE